MFRKILITIAILQSATTFASIQVLTTRVIFSEPSNEASVSIKNKGDSPHLVQVWLEDLEGNTKLPFIITPPITRVDPEEGQVYRIIKTEQETETETETVYWLNFLDIPPTKRKYMSENSMQFAIKTRIKFFYRPMNLSNKKRSITQDIKWIISEDDSSNSLITCINKSPFIYSFTSIKFRESDKEPLSSGGMCLAHSKNAFRIQKSKMIAHGTRNKLVVDIINDYGGIEKHTFPISK
ncbi:fimbrial biogenesis chaperone [Vibrio metschnikovii]|uniref:fimbrial biogenesis chaperone n=1 Tax=Vibrio metschnikovii TaxID=28172 RepID=UPI001C2F57DE|nr:molecular chaperone [Vibrio metschnikovii]